MALAEKLVLIMKIRLSSSVCNGSLVAFRSGPPFVPRLDAGSTEQGRRGRRGTWKRNEGAMLSVFGDHKALRNAGYNRLHVRACGTTTIPARRRVIDNTVIGISGARCVTQDRLSVITGPLGSRIDPPLEQLFLEAI